VTSWSHGLCATQKTKCLLLPASAIRPMTEADWGQCIVFQRESICWKLLWEFSHDTLLGASAGPRETHGDPIRFSALQRISWISLNSWLTWSWRKYDLLRTWIILDRVTSKSNKTTPRSPARHNRHLLTHTISAQILHIVTGSCGSKPITLGSWHIAQRTASK
jgi:hypothetical protein